MIGVQAGHAFDAILEGAPAGLVGVLGVRVVDPTTEQTVVARTTAGINEYPAGSGVYGVTLTAPAIGSHDSPWPVSILWDTGSPLTPGGVFTEELLIYAGPVPLTTTPGVFATAEDVATRLGRDLTATEAGTVDFMLISATAIILDAVDKPGSWATALDPVPPVLQMMCVELVIRALPNTGGSLRAESETLGAYSYSRSYDTTGGGGGGGLMLTDAEARMCRNVVYGTLTGSSTPRALTDRLIDVAEGRDIDEITA